MNRQNELKGMIYTKFPTEAAMARSLGWPSQRLNRITTGSREPSLKEVEAIADALGQPFLKIAQFFLPQASTIC